MKPNNMKNPTTIAALLLLLTSTIGTPLIYAADEHAHEEEEAEAPEGSHGGRLLSDGEFEVELTIFEDSAEPEYRAWAYQDGELIQPGQWTLNVQLERLGGETNALSFTPDGEFLRSTSAVEEPHSFEVAVNASYQGGSHSWEFDSHEGRIELSTTLADQLGVETAVAGPGLLHQTVLLYGRTTPDPLGVSHVSARFPGMIRSISADLGARVEKGDDLAVIEANNSLQSYTITAPIAGTVIQRHANPGEVAGDQPLLTIADYSRVWADLDVFPSDARAIQVGQSVTIRMGELSADSSILYLNPGAGESPNVVARVPLDSPDGAWTPGLLVEGDAVIADIPVNLMVDNRALQTVGEERVVFIKVGDAYEARPLELGRGDGRFTEVLEGLAPGSEYVVGNSYLIKADLEKSGASHEH
jgi:cobalt-zinc-cadmium efflux system membrane fusion protein